MQNNDNDWIKKAKDQKSWEEHGKQVLNQQQLRPAPDTSEETKHLTEYDTPTRNDAVGKTYDPELRDKIDRAKHKTSEYDTGCGYDGVGKIHDPELRKGSSVFYEGGTDELMSVPHFLSFCLRF